MLSFVFRRLLWAMFVVAVTISGVFFLMNGVGDPARARLGPKASAAQLEAFREKCGLKAPLVQRYATFLGGIATGDLGRTCPEGREVSALIAARLPRTMLLGAMAIFLEVLLGASIGIWAATRKGTWFDTAVMSTTFLMVSAPTFVTGLLFLNYAAFRLGWFPVGGYGVSMLDHVRHALLPALTLAIIGTATQARLMRSEMIETLRSDYVRTARAKGASEPRAILRHAARNAMLPLVTLTGLNASLVVSGAIITEAIYGWPGMGRLAVESITSLDVPTVLGVVLVASLGVQLANLLADLLVAALDPRIRLA